MPAKNVSQQEVQAVMAQVTAFSDGHKDLAEDVGTVPFCTRVACHCDGSCSGPLGLSAAWPEACCRGCNGADGSTIVADDRHRRHPPRAFGSPLLAGALVSHSFVATCVSAASGSQATFVIASLHVDSRLHVFNLQSLN